MRFVVYALAAAVVIVAIPVARAGGDFVDLAVGRGRVWFVGEPGVKELATDGRLLASPQPGSAAHPLSVAILDGAAWIGAVENGFQSGSLSRIDERTGTVRAVWRRADSSVQYVASGGGSIWALIGLRRTMEVVRFSSSGRRSGVWPVPGAGRMAADTSGAWVSTNEWLVHIDVAGQVTRVARAQLGDVATGLGFAWLPQATVIVRVDERSGRIRVLHTGPLRLGGFQHDTAVGAGALWTLRDTDRTRSTLERRDIDTGHLTKTQALPGIADAVVATPTAVWVATVRAPLARRATEYNLIRLSPRTLETTRLVRVGP